MSILSDYREILLRRQLINFLAHGQLKASVQGTALGMLWYLLVPLSQILIYYFMVVIVFNKGSEYAHGAFLGISMGIMHYSLFNHANGYAMPSVSANSSLLLQIKMEPLVLVAAGFLKSMRIAAAGVGTFLVLYLASGGPVSERLIAYPLILLLWIWLIWSIAVFTAAASVYVRDLQRLMPIIAQILMYASPVIYSVTTLPPRLSDVLLLNPIAAIFALLQWCLLGADPPPLHALLVLPVMLLALSCAAHWYFGWARRSFTKAF